MFILTLELQQLHELQNDRRQCASCPDLDSPFATTSRRAFAADGDRKNSFKVAPKEPTIDRRLERMARAMDTRSVEFVSK